MSKIHRPPRGLQHLLGSQSFGQNPDELAMVVRPSLELGPYYAAELLKTQSVIGATSTEGKIGGVTFAAPVALIAAGIESGTAVTANEYVGMNIRLDGLGGTNESVVIASTDIYIDATGYPTFGHMFPQPLVVPGGCEVSGYFHGLSSNLLTVTFRVLYVDLNPIDDT